MTREKIVEAARGWLGTPYLHQGSLRGIGCDCLGLVRGVWRECVGAEPEPVTPYSPHWAEATRVEQLLDAGRRHFTPVPPQDFRPGDVLAFRWRLHVPAKHLAIVVGEACMIHAHDGACVAQAPMSPWWRRRIAAAFRFPGVTD